MHAGAGELGLLGAAAYVPFLLLGLPAGVLVDRMRRRGVLIAADVFQLIAIASIPALAAFGRLTIPALLTAAFAAGCGRVLFEIAYRAYLPAVVPMEHLTQANSRLSASESVAEIGGPGLGGWLVQTIGAPYALVVDALSYFVSAVGLARIKTREERPTPSGTTWRQQVSDGFSLTFRNRYLRAFAGEAASYNFAWQIVQTILVLFAVQTLGLSPGLLGLSIAVGSGGALLGALITPAASRRFGLGRTVVMAAVIGDAAPLALPFLHAGSLAAPALAIALFIRGLGITGCNVHVNAIRQTVTPASALGRTNAAYRLLVYGAVPLGSLLGGWLGDALGLRPTLAVATLMLLTTCLWLICSPVRGLHGLQYLKTGQEAGRAG